MISGERLSCIFQHVHETIATKSIIYVCGGVMVRVSNSMGVANAPQGPQSPWTMINLNTITQRPQIRIAGDSHVGLAVEKSWVRLPVVSLLL